MWGISKEKFPETNNYSLEEIRNKTSCGNLTVLGKVSREFTTACSAVVLAASARGRGTNFVTSAATLLIFY
jgi:hypothetical protein